MNCKRMICWLLALVLCLGCLQPLAALPVRAADDEEPVYSGVCGANGDNLTWSFDPETGKLTIEGSGMMKSWNQNWQNDPPPWESFRDSVTSVELPEELESIGAWAFNGTNIRSIRLPSNITYIGHCAFFQCDRLASVSFPEALTTIDDSAFKYSGVRQLFLPKRLKTIGEEAFEFCTDLETVFLPASLKNLGSGAFAYCTKLKAFELDSGSEFFALDASGAILSKDKTTLVSFPAGIGKRFSIPAGIETIGSQAFSGCTQLLEVTIPEGVKQIQDGAFFNCLALRTVRLPASVEMVASQAFGNCKALTEIRVDEANANYRSDKSGVLYTKDWTTLISFPCGLQGAYAVPDGVFSIDQLACAYCDGLTAITFPDTLERVGYFGFIECNNLREVVLPASVKHLDYASFGNDSKLERITVLNPDCEILDSGSILGIAGKTVVIGYAGSTAQTYAEKYGYTFRDINSGNVYDYDLGEDVDPELPQPVPLNDEVTHLIFADMAYARIPESFEGKTVAQWLSAKTYNQIPAESPGYDKTEMSRPAFKGSDMNRIRIYSMVGDWIIRDVIEGEAGYAAVVFRKGEDVIIAYRGSEGGPQTVFNGEDWYVDAEFALMNYLDPKQFDAALETCKSYLRGVSGSVTLTGHSLGGALVTYVSLVTGAKGYSFDGAAGHVVDLTYLFEPTRIFFTSKYAMPFTNFTDPASLATFGADLIQHTRTDLYPGVCYETNPDAIAYYPGLFWTHQQYSNTRPTADGKGLEFMPLAERHYVANRYYASVDYAYLGILIGAAGVGSAAPGLGKILDGVLGGTLGAFRGRLAKKGGVILGSTLNDDLSVANMTGLLDCTANVTTNVLYGGDGTDTLVGAASGDILVSGCMEGDHLSGGLGDDVYVIDTTYRGNVYISDTIGSDSIILNSRNSYSYYSVTALGFDEDSNSYGFNVTYGCNVYLSKTLLRHSFTVYDAYGNQLCVIDTKGELDKKAPTQDEASCKEITMEGPCQFTVYAPDGTAVSSYDTAKPGLYTEEFGTVYLTCDDEDETKLLTSVVLYDDYTLELEGAEPVDVGIVGTDEENYVNRVTVAEGLDLSKGEATVTPERHEITQLDAPVAATETEKTVSVTLDRTALSLKQNETATLRAEAAFADGSKTGEVYFTSADPSVVACETKEDGSCVLTAVGGGETEVYAVAADSGVFAVCKISVEGKEPEQPKNPFVDVPADAYYTAPVLWAVEHAITAGTDKTHFSPNDTCTRAQVVTFLWRAAGNPEPQTGNNPFKDVKPSDYFYKPVLWAVENKITAGTSATTFSPNDGCTRGQVVTFLWRSAGNPAPGSSKNPFTDVKSDAYFYDPVLWAVEHKITAGTSDTTFSPNDTCTRAQIVTFLYRDLAE